MVQYGECTHKNKHFTAILWKIWLFLRLESLSDSHNSSVVQDSFLSLSTCVSSLFNASLSLRGWRCIRKCLASGWAPQTRPCPSSPSRGSPPTPREALYDTNQDKTPHLYPDIEDMVRAWQHAKRDDKVIHSRLLSLPFMPSLLDAVPQRICFMLLMPPGGF